MPTLLVVVRRTGRSHLCRGLRRKRSGGVVKVARYNEQQDTLDYLFSLDEMVNDPGDSGRATQCKIHYSFAPSWRTASFTWQRISPARRLISRRIHRGFRGTIRSVVSRSALLAFDTQKDQVLWWDTMIPKEGCRCLLHDEERHLLYALSYPRDHFIIYDTRKRTRRDVGRIG